jgi:hypothetical protein
VSSWLYFFPGGNVTNPSNVPAECELADVLGGASFSCRMVDNFQGHQGSLISVHPAYKSGGIESDCAYLPDRQTWIAVTTEDSKLTHFVGFFNDARPTPADLLRPNACAGTAVELDGNSWIVPSVHLDCALPMTPHFVKRNAPLTFEVLPQYRKLMDDAKRVWEKVVTDTLVSFQQASTFAIGCLGVNYRVGIPEVCSLGIINTVTAFQVARAGLGLTAYEEEMERQKKSASATAF